VKPWVASVIRGLIILVAILVGLIGLLMSACGGLLLMGGVTGGSLVVVGLAGIAACVGFLVWVRHASHRTLIIILGAILGLLLLAWLLWHMPGHGLH
jgi:hypothetical protein